MGLGFFKPLAASLLLHSVTAGAFAWSFLVLLEYQHAATEPTGPRIVLSSELDASKATFEQLVQRSTTGLQEIERPRMERPPETWVSHQTPQSRTPQVASYPVASFQATPIGIPNARRPGHLGAVPLSPEAAPIAVGSGAEGAAGAGNSTAILSATGVTDTGIGGGELWGQLGPIPLDNEKPDYPHSLQRRGVGGTVQLLLIVTEQGTVKEATIVESSGSETLDESALAAARKWRFKAVGNGTSTARVKRDVNFTPP